MNNYKQDIFSQTQEIPKLKSGTKANAFLSRVFTLMTLGLGITGLSAWLFASKVLVDQIGATEMFSGFQGMLLMLAPLAFVLLLSFGMRRMNYLGATIAFIAFAVVMGISISYIFMFYAMGSIFNVFLITAGTFGVMALLGATTKIDLTKMGNILYMAVVGIILASVVNYFMASSTMHFIISIVGVLVFSGLTAYDTQKMLRIGAQVEFGSESANKMAVMGALSLYLDFINMFLFLLRIFGGIGGSD